MSRTGNSQIYSEQHPVAQEAAILHAAGFEAAAMALLEAETAGSPGAMAPRPWLMLFELHQAAGARDAFERLLARYARAFPGATPPPWKRPAPIVSAGTLALAGTLDRASGCMDRIVAHAAGRRSLALDLACVERIAFDFVGDLAALLRTLHLQGKRVIVANAAELHAALLESVGAEQCAVIMRRRCAAASHPGHSAAPAPAAALERAAA